MQDSLPVNTFLVDDSDIHLAGLRWILSANKEIKVTGTATSPGLALQHKELPLADVVLLDISLETDDDGIDLIKPILALKPGIKIIMLSHNKDVKSVVRSVQNGAAAYIAKDASIEEINMTIGLVLKGNGFFMGETIPKDILAGCLPENGSAHHAKHTRPWNISERETEIINLLAKGFITKEIADLLHINHTTVESHKENIKQKLNCKTIIEVVVFSLKNGLIS